MKTLRWLPAVGLFSAMAAACSTEPQPATGDMLHPTGLAYVTRTASRADLFVADSEAGGVQILQLQRRLEKETVVDDAAFVRSEALFFPLLMAAPSYPSLVAPSIDGLRLYALSTPDDQLHVMDVTETPYGTSAAESTSYRSFTGSSTAGMSIQNLVPEPAVAVAMATIPSAPDELDRLLIVFDQLGSGEGRLVVVGVLPALSLRLVDSSTLAASPRSLALRAAAPPSVLVASAATSSVSLIAFDPANLLNPLGVHRSLDAGGPTGAVIDAGTSGAAALRIDRSAAVVFDLVGGSLARSQRMIRSPATPATEIGDPSLLGVIDLIPAPPVCGAHGRLPVLPDPAVTDKPTTLFSAGDLGPDGLGDALMIAHADAQATFLLGTPLRPAIGPAANLGRLEPLSSDQITAVGCTMREPTTCEQRVALGASAEKLPSPECGAGVVTEPTAKAKRLQAIYRGPLAKEEGGALIPTATVAGRFTLLPRAVHLAERALELGDRAWVQAKLELPCGGPLKELVATASVTGISAEGVTLGFTANSSIAQAQPCGGSTSIPLLRYELYPSQEQFVVLELEGGVPAAVVERPLVTPAGRGAQVRVTGGGVLDLTLTASTGFACVEVPLEGAWCAGDLDCAGRRCQPSFVAGCLGRCEIACQPADPGCLSHGLERRCSGVELELSAGQLAQAHTGLDGSAGTGIFQPAAPDSMVFSPMRRSWIVSFPGARALTEAFVRPGGESGQGIGRRAFR